MMNPFMSYTQSFNESMTKDDREDVERRMAAANSRASYGGPSGSGYVQPTAKPINAGIASPAAIAQSKMTKDAREDAERRMSTTTPSASYGGPSGSGYTRTGRMVVVPNAPYAGPSGTLTAKTETDWAKLALQIGAAYLLLA